MTTMVKPGDKLTFRDRLSQLTFDQAVKLLGPQGKKLIQQGGKWDVDLARDTYFRGDLLRVTLPTHDGGVARASLTASADKLFRLVWNCDRCEGACEHVGAMFSLVLEHKVALGLAAPPPERKLAVELTEEELVAQALAERRDRAKAEKMKVVASGARSPWTDYAVTSLVSGKAYRVALRGVGAGESYCSCPDFRTNTLGTCKHVMKVAGFARKKFGAAALARSYRFERIEVFLRYGEQTELRVGAPAKMPDDVAAIIKPLVDKPIGDPLDLLRRLQRLEKLSAAYHVFPDAEEYIQQQLHHDRLASLVADVRRDPVKHPLRTSLLKVPLLPYQLDGIAFVAGAGRAVLADDMGLGKTMQGVGVAELLAREAGIRKVLVICPASLKSQWRNEIARFCGRDVQLIGGRTAERTGQYNNDCFYTICNYEQVLRDILSIEQTPWDLIILDEGQRIKNWETKTTRVIKGLKSKFALVLTGTPLENRLDDLYSVVQFVDDRRLGPGFRFFHRHRILDEKGKLVGYKNLAQLRAQLQPVLLRRTRESVRLELPERVDEFVRIQPTDEQLVLHAAHAQIVATVVRKPYISEMDMLRLRAALLACRMTADGTYLVTKEKPNYSSKLDRLAEIFDDIAAEPTRKVVLFSEWTTMLDLIEPLLKKRKLAFVRLDGSVPQSKRQQLVQEFQTNSECRFFLTTNAGSTGLNLQAANTVINVDLPWNPAVLEQRVARAYRMGQKQPVQVLILMTEGTIEEQLLTTLSAKRDLALAALDPESATETVDMQSGREDLKAKLEVLLGAKQEASLDKTMEQTVATSVSNNEHRERVAAAGGQLLAAVFQFLGELVDDRQSLAPAAEPTAVRELRHRLDECVEEDADGRARLTVTLPNRAAIDGLAQTLAKLLATSKAP